MPPKSVGLLSVADITTGSSNTVDAKDNGAYPFYDRSQVIKRSDKYLFDCEAVIVPGEGVDFIPRYASGKFDLHQRAYAVFPKESVNGKYLYYAILNNKNHFAQVATGSTVKSLRLKSFELMEIPFVDLDTQIKISKILSDLDDKIALNQAINDNLEKLCYSKYYSVMQKITDFCDIGQLSDLGEIIGGSTPSKSVLDYYSVCDIPWITPKDLSENKSKFISRGAIDITEKGLKNSSARLMPRGTILYTSRAPIGYIAIAKNPITTNQGFKSIIPLKDCFRSYIYYYLKDNFELVNGLASGSTFMEISGSSMKTIPIPIITEDLGQELESFCKAKFELQEYLEEENCSLNQLKDYLLPKLVSGEIDVSSLGESQLNNHLLAEFLLMENLCLLLKSKLIGMLDNESISIVISELSQILKECSTETNITDPNIRNNNLLNSFLSAKRLEGCSEKTISYYQSTLQMFLTDSKHDIISITTDHIRNYLSEYQSERKSSKVTIDNIRRIFSSFFSWLEDEEYILKSPVRRIHKVKFGRTVKETFTDEELEKMRDSCNNIRNLSILDTFISTGMRVGELVKLNITDVDFDGRECIVFGKGDCERRVYFDARTKLHLQSYLEHRSDTNPALFVTQNKPTKRISINGVESMLKVLGNNIGLTDIHPHKFRRTMATRAIDKGMPIEQVQKLLGHVRIDTTLHYAMVNQENVKNAHKKYVA